ncbi:hypothetical protein [Ewingella americana]|uniref:hypothetical protein n=1 Tax=Ewingella americana TaxID=41202 RepID=UPI003B96904C
MKFKVSNRIIILTQIEKTENSIIVFRSLIAGLDFSHLEDTQLYDLNALAYESAEGLCHGLLCLSEGLENSEILPPEGASNQCLSKSDGASSTTTV